MCSPTIIMNNNDIAATCKSLRRVRRRSPTTVVQDTTTQEFEELTATSMNGHFDYESKINDMADNQQSERPKLTERRACNGSARRSRPDAGGRINGKECHAFAFAAQIEEALAADL